MSARRWVRLAAAGLALVSLARPGAAAPQRSVHALRWFVHADLLAPAGRTLADYEALVARRSREAERLLEGLQGPTDTGCCLGLEAVSVEAFGRAGDGFDVVTSDAELDVLAARAPGAYLVRSVFCCGCDGSPDTSILACADTPGDFLVMSLDAEDEGVFAATLAHERGHNAGLLHVAETSCELMAPVAGGSCLDPGECRSYRAGGLLRGEPCACLDDRVDGPPRPDGELCTGAPGSCGLCSGGVCGACGSPAEEQLWSAAGTGLPAEAPSREALVHSGLTGGWRPVGSAAEGAEVTALAYAARRGRLYGIESGGPSGDDRLILLDPRTGRKAGTVASLAGWRGVAGLAYDPGTGLGADRLLAARPGDASRIDAVTCAAGVPCVTTLLAIDPTNGSTRVLGELDAAALVVSDGVTGLAFDPEARALFGASRAGIHRILLPCDAGRCRVERVSAVFRRPSSLAWDPLRRGLLHLGSSFGETRLDVYPGPVRDREATVRLAPFTPGGLAVVPAPEPGSLGPVVALAALALGWRCRVRPSGPGKRSDILRAA